MGDTIYLASVVKILEKPVSTVFNNNLPITRVRVQFPQFRTNTIVTLVFWGKLSEDVCTYYNKDDYILIEGYPSLRETLRETKKADIIEDTKALKAFKKVDKKVEITVLKVYPFLLSSNRQITIGV